MEQNHGAVGGPPDDEDVFGPAGDDEEVFEWIDDEADDGEPGEQAPQRPRLTFRERLAAVRSTARRLRHSRREIAAALAALVLACAVGGACTAWFDGVAGAADRAAVVSLTVDSVVNGDPAAATYNAHDSSAVGQYVVEIANNAPEAVTLTSVSVDAGTLMTSTAWKPLSGSPRIPGGGTAKIALTAKLFCPMVVLSAQTGIFGVSEGIGGGLSLAFPALDVQARDSDGDLRAVVLPTRVLVSSQLPDDTRQLTFQSPDGEPVPQIVTADLGACSQYLTARAAERQAANDSAARFPATVEFGYDGVLAPAGHQAFTLGFKVKNTSDHPVVLSSRANVSFPEDSRLRTTWLPSEIRLGPGQSAPARLTVAIQDCTSILTGAPILGDTMLEETDGTDNGPAEPVFPDQALTTGSLRLAGDIVQQEKAACS